MVRLTRTILKNTPDSFSETLILRARRARKIRVSEKLSGVLL